MDCMHTIKKIYHRIRRLLEIRKRIRGTGNMIDLGDSIVRGLRIDIRGSNNTIRFHNGTIVEGLHVKMQGNGHELVIGDKAWLYKSRMHFEDNNCHIRIGDGCLANNATISAVEDGSVVDVGPRVGLSEGCDLRTSDSHSIVDLKTGKRINPPGNITIGEHAWIGKEVMVLKGVNIGAHTTVGLRSVVTRDLHANCLAVGSPAKAIKENVTWDYDKLPVG